MSCHLHLILSLCLPQRAWAAPGLSGPVSAHNEPNRLRKILFKDGFLGPADTEAGFSLCHVTGSLIFLTELLPKPWPVRQPLRVGHFCHVNLKKVCK